MAGLGPPHEPRRRVEYSGLAKLAFVRGLGDTWRDLADVLGIPAYDTRRFSQGDEPREIWEWLEQRDDLGRLPGALRLCDRPELAGRLNDDRQLARANEADDPDECAGPTSPALTVAPSTRDELLAQLTTLDLRPADWWLVASRTAEARRLLDRFVAGPFERDGGAVGVAQELALLLATLSSAPGADAQWRQARELCDVLTAALLRAGPG